jgi:hypothetical protein
MSMKNSDDTIGNQTRDLPVCGAVPQITAPPYGLKKEGALRNVDVARK